jgi:precorrin-4 methylase
MHLNYPRLFEALKRRYPENTPVAVVSVAADLEKQRVIRSTVGRFLTEVDSESLPVDRHTPFVGKFLEVGQKRKGFVPKVVEPAERH